MADVCCSCKNKSNFLIFTFSISGNIIWTLKIAITWEWKVIWQKNFEIWSSLVISKHATIMPELDMLTVYPLTEQINPNQPALRAAFKWFLLHITSTAVCWEEKGRQAGTPDSDYITDWSADTHTRAIKPQVSSKQSLKSRTAEEGLKSHQVNYVNISITGMSLYIQKSKVYKAIRGYCTKDWKSKNSITFRILYVVSRLCRISL